MKRFFMSVVLSLLLGVAFPPALSAEGSKALTILFTGSVKGTLDPCAA
jgi:hypothetical protein